MNIHNKAILALSKENYRLAGLFLEEARLKNPHDPKSWYLSGVLFHKIGNLLQAQEFLVKAISSSIVFGTLYPLSEKLSGEYQTKLLTFTL